MLRVRRRSTAPAPKNPRIIIAQVAGSGTAETPPSGGGGTIPGGPPPGGGDPTKPGSPGSPPPGVNGAKKGEAKAGSPPAPPVPPGRPPAPGMPSDSAATSAGVRGSAAGGASPAAGSRSRISESTRSVGPRPGFVESKAPAPRSPGERAANSDKGSASAAMIPALRTLPAAGWPSSTTDIKRSPVRKGTSKSARFHRLRRSEGAESRSDASSVRPKRRFTCAIKVPRMLPTPSKRHYACIRLLVYFEPVAWLSSA